MSQFENLKIKVCGLTQLLQVQELILMNVDFLGFIFYEKSPRFVLNHLSLNEISGINHEGKVGVFVNETVENIESIAEDAALKYIQLHGDEDENYVSELRSKLDTEIKIIKVLRIGSETHHLQLTINNSQLADYFLFDTDSKAFGGTGKTFDWQILNGLEITKPYFLSGGISEENVNGLHYIKQQPFVLDINSKFETEPGIKDVEKINELIKTMKTKSSHEVTK